MNNKNVLPKLIGLGLIVLTIASACTAAATTAAPVNLQASSTPQTQNTPTLEVASSTPAATATVAPSPVPTSTSTPAPTETGAPTATGGSAQGAQIIPTLNAYCRKGPALGYYAITFLQKGIPYDVSGRDAYDSWWQVQAQGNVVCWVGNANVTTQGAVDQVSIVPVPPLPDTPAVFVASSTCYTALKSMSVALNWSAVDHVTGYRIYRNGVALAELGPSVTSYGDNAASNLNLAYELEAFNDLGVAVRISTTVYACP